MIDVKALKKKDTMSTLNPWDNRLPDVFEALGPSTMGVPPEDGVTELWTADRVSDIEVVLRSPEDIKHTIKVVPSAAQFTFSFDLNGRLCYGYWDTKTDEVVWNFFHDLQGEVVTERFDGTHPASALDSYKPRAEPPVDVVLGYMRDGELFVRYQRERYNTEHRVAKVSSEAKLRTMGISRDNRFIFRFFSNVGEVTNTSQ